MRIEKSNSGGVLILKVFGKIDQPACRKLHSEFGSLVAKENYRIAVDLSEVSYLNSMALGILVSTMKSVRSRGGDLRLSGLADMVMDVFRITRLSTVFKIHPTMAEAVAGFSED